MTVLSSPIEHLVTREQTYTEFYNFPLSICIHNEILACIMVRREGRPSALPYFITIAPLHRVEMAKTHL